MFGGGSKEESTPLTGSSGPKPLYLAPRSNSISQVGWIRSSDSFEGSRCWVDACGAMQHALSKCDPPHPFPSPPFSFGVWPRLRLLQVDVEQVPQATGASRVGSKRGGKSDRHCWMYGWMLGQMLTPATTHTHTHTRNHHRSSIDRRLPERRRRRVPLLDLALRRRRRARRRARRPHEDPQGARQGGAQGLLLQRAHLPGVAQHVRHARLHLRRHPRVRALQMTYAEGERQCHKQKRHGRGPRPLVVSFAPAPPPPPPPPPTTNRQPTTTNTKTQLRGPQRVLPGLRLHRPPRRHRLRRLRPPHLRQAVRA